eukprot:scaffold82391_cov57-Phaeocystis_antarctica.AAC.2
MFCIVSWLGDGPLYLPRLAGTLRVSERSDSPEGTSCAARSPGGARFGGLGVEPFLWALYHDSALVVV